jgi:N-formylglutamate amidohydrolase
MSVPEVPSLVHVFRVVEPAGGRPGPIVLSSPHSGRFLPPDLSPPLRLRRTKLRALEDGPVDHLVGGCCQDGATLIAALYGRAFVDLNRSPVDLDPGLLRNGAAPPPLEPSLKARAGLGVIPTRVGSDEIYGLQLTPKELEARLHRAWHPYHSRLDELVAARRAAFGSVLLLDCHSMPSEAAVRGRRPIDVALGDRYGKACHPHLVDLAAAFFAALGLKVARNQPYAGGYITERHGRPGEGRHALQVEFRRALFMNEADGTPTSGLQALGNAFRAFVRELDRHLRRNLLSSAA